MTQLRQFCFSAILWLAAGLPLPAIAQAPALPAANRVNYDAAFYSAFSPRTALDMIRQTPGFVFDEGDEELRGFTGAVGNVLIDGERLSAKSQLLSDVLARVPASEVVRIEILRGTETAGDASGAAVLANVVRTRSANNGTWSLGPEVTNQEKPAPTGSLAWSGRSDATQYSLGANMYTHDHEAGHVGEVTDGAGAVIAERRGTTPHQDGQYALNGQVSFPAGGGQLTFTGQAAFAEHEEAWSLRTTTPDDALIESEYAPYQEDTRSGEGGVNWQRPVGQWDMELVALLTRRNFGSDVTYTHFDATGMQDLQSMQTVDQDSGESILRGTFTRSLGRGQFETGGEIAINTLDGTSDLTEDIGAGPVPIDLPNADLSVEENRAEGFLSYATPLDDNWSFDARLAAEISRLSFTGDTEQSVSLTYVKPRVQFTRKFGDHQLQMRIFRDVGQLDFTDFVSTAQLADDVIEGGNPDLRPQTAWAVEFDTDLRFPGDTALRVRLFRHYLDDVVDLVAVGPPEAQFDAPGNIGEGTVTGVQVSLRVPLQPVLPGATFSVNTTLRDSEVTDPTTGARRQISDFIENELGAELRQDLTAARFAWGLVFQGYSPETDYGLRETDSFRQLRRLDAWIETTAFAAFKLRLTVNSITGDTERRDRRFYEPDRNGVLFARELSYFRPGTWWLLTASGSF